MTTAKIAFYSSLRMHFYYMGYPRFYIMDSFGNAVEVAPAYYGLISHVRGEH